MITPASACTAISNVNSIESIRQPGLAGSSSAFSSFERNWSATSATLSATSPARFRNCSGTARPGPRSPETDLGRTSSRISGECVSLLLAFPAIVPPRGEKPVLSSTFAKKARTGQGIKLLPIHTIWICLRSIQVGKDSAFATTPSATPRKARHGLADVTDAEGAYAATPSFLAPSLQPNQYALAALASLRDGTKRHPAP